ELRQIKIDVPVVTPLEHLLFQQAIEITERKNKTRSRVYLPMCSNFHHVIVPMPVRVIALSVQRAVFFFAQLFQMKAMRSREPVNSRDGGHNISPSRTTSTKRSFVSNRRTRASRAPGTEIRAS